MGPRRFNDIIHLNTISQIEELKISLLKYILYSVTDT